MGQDAGGVGVERRDAAVGHASLHLAPQAGVGQQRHRIAVGLAAQQAQADMGEAVVRRHRHHVGRRQLRHRVVGERQRIHAAPPAA
ncbi:hypothetical protein [Azospirillum brasilense]|uniref:hypothetical protein n=1 Tax=Azospirillum brasilense TaxID=192 RepID=UPI0012DD1673